jgi:hypothetical protein
VRVSLQQLGDLSRVSVEVCIIPRPDNPHHHSPTLMTTDQTTHSVSFAQAGILSSKELNLNVGVCIDKLKQSCFLLKEYEVVMHIF